MYENDVVFDILHGLICHKTQQIINLTKQNKQIKVS